MFSKAALIVSALKLNFTTPSLPVKPLPFVASYSQSQGVKMPKKSGGKGGGGKSKTSNEGAASSNVTAKSPIVVGKDGAISISIQVKPGAKLDTITDISEDAVGVQISAPPVDGEANTGIVKYFAEILKVKKADVSLKGGKSRQKTILVSPSTGLTSSAIIALLETEMRQR